MHLYLYMTKFLQANMCGLSFFLLCGSTHYLCLVTFKPSWPSLFSVRIVASHMQTTENIYMCSGRWGLARTACLTNSRGRHFCNFPHMPVFHWQFSCLDFVTFVVLTVQDIWESAKIKLNVQKSKELGISIFHRSDF